MQHYLSNGAHIATCPCSGGRFTWLHLYMFRHLHVYSPRAVSGSLWRSKVCCKMDITKDCWCFVFVPVWLPCAPAAAAPCPLPADAPAAATAVPPSSNAPSCPRSSSEPCWPASESDRLLLHPLQSRGPVRDHLEAFGCLRFVVRQPVCQ